MERTSKKLDWYKLLNPARRKELAGTNESMGTKGERLEIERDYDRILFASPTRRLADKTQVFPMEINDSVRNRLTHSHEVSNLARSIGIQLAFVHDEKVFGEASGDLQVKRSVPSLLAAVGLAHDLGNPPFGHQGELAVRQWFKEENLFKGQESEFQDFLEFDGNAQTFRLLTKLQVLNDKFGLNLTVATLAALLKYPSIYGSENKGGFKKYGIFVSEKEIIEEVWRETGLEECVRHPLAYVMEACDDIAYSIIDAEDTVKKGYASFYDMINYLKSVKGKDPEIDSLVEKAVSKNREFKESNLSSRELNDISMQMFRVQAIFQMVSSATSVFVEKIDAMLNRSIEPGFELIKNSSCAKLCRSVKEFDYNHGFQNREVLRLELQGNNYIKSMMTMLWRAVSIDNKNDHPFERYVFGEISENYRRVYEESNKGLYNKCQLVCDALAGMTERYLINKHDEYKSLENIIS